MAGSLLPQLVLAYGAGVVVVLLLLKIRVPTVVGFLVAGVLLGPHGLGLVEDVETVGALADIGVVILLFTIGVEMSLARVMKMGGAVLLAGGLQVALTAAGVAIPLGWLQGGWGRAVILGLLVAASSTTLLLRTLGERGELDAPQGRVAVGISIVQDLCMVPIMVLLPLMGGTGTEAGALGWALGKAALALVGTVVLARYVVPYAFELVVNTRSRELFALTVIFLCLGTAYLASLAGLSLALGAFLGGLVVSESPYSQQVLGEMLPIRDGLSGLFFIGVGMLLNLGHVAADPLPVLGIVAGILVLKTLVTASAVAAAGYDLRTAVLAGVALCQVGEFSFVLSREAGRLGLLDAASIQLFLAAAVLTMVASPFLYRVAPALADALDRSARGRLRGRRSADAVAPAASTQHVVVVGYGLTGKNVARALLEHGYTFVAIEMNPETVRRERAAGVPIFFGDAGHPEVLEKAGIHRARLVVVAISDAPGTRRVVSVAKRMAPTLRVIVRTRYLREVEELMALGADEVVPDEVETSVEIFARVLRAYDLPSDAIEATVRSVRTEAFAAVRSSAPREGVKPHQARELAHVDLETHVVGPGAPAEGQTIGGLDVRRRFGVTVAGVRRAGEVLPDAGPDTRFQAADVVVLMGPPDRLAAAASLFRAGATQRVEGTRAGAQEDR